MSTRPSQPATPLLAGATVFLSPRFVVALLDDLLGVAARAAASQLASLDRLRVADIDVLTLMAASINHDAEPVHRVALDHGVNADALVAVVQLLAQPLLTNSRQAAVSESWIEPYCPHCGSWPVFAEVRGIERRRFYRCGRCGDHWHAQHLRCPFCATTDHEQLAALVSENVGPASDVDACNVCRGYMKTLTRLQGCAPDKVMLEDLATVDLDVAAVQLGYSRPAGAGYPLAVNVVAAPRARS